MNCEMAEKYLSAYLDDILDPQLHDEVEAHLESCAVCGEVVAEYRRFDTLLRETPRISPPPELRDRIFNSPEMAAILRQESIAGEAPAQAPVRPRRPPTRGSPPRWTRIALQSAAVIAIIVGSALLFRQGFFHFGTTTTGGSTSTPAIEGPTQAPPAPLGAGRRVVYEHGGDLWSGPEVGPNLGQQLNSTNIHVSTIWSVSPDGKLVAYAEAGTGRIHIIRADGQEDTPTSSFSAICEGNFLCADFPPSLVWSPNGKYIAYQASDGKLHLLTVAGSSDQTVSAGSQGVVTSLLWSIHSQQLAFVGANGQAESIWSFSLASGSLSMVAASPDSANRSATIRDIYWLTDTPLPTLTWSTWVANTQSLTGIFSRELGSSPIVRLTPDGLRLTGAGFTPLQGGIWLVAAISQGGTPEIGTIAVAHPGLQITNATPQITIKGVYWSPLGDTAAVVTTTGQMFLATDNGALLASGLNSVTGTPVWSPDGSHLATPLNSGIISLDIIAGNFKGVHRLLPSLAMPASVTMLWSPDSQDIAISTPSGVYLTSSDAKITKQIDPQTASGLLGWSLSG
jgi:WD40 repeat protein